MTNDQQCYSLFVHGVSAGAVSGRKDLLGLARSSLGLFLGILLNRKGSKSIVSEWGGRVRWKRRTDLHGKTKRTCACGASNQCEYLECFGRQSVCRTECNKTDQDQANPHQFQIPSSYQGLFPWQYHPEFDPHLSVCALCQHPSCTACSSSSFFYCF